MLAASLAVGCHRPQSEGDVLNPQQRQQAIAELRAAYGAFNRNDIDGAIKLLDPDVEWIEPAEFPGGGTYHGIEGARRYLSHSRAGAAEVISDPEKFISAGDRIVVFVHARVRPLGSNAWQDIKLADVYTFHAGRVTLMRAFADRRAALDWVGIKQSPN